MDTDLPVTVILNATSGHQDAEKTEAEIRAGFEEAGRTVNIVVAGDPVEVERAARRAISDAKRQPGVIAAAGGDGTINLVATLVIEADLPFGIIPLGTFNYLARHLGIALEPRAAAHALATGLLRRVHVGRVNGHLFLNNASFGLYRKLLEEREGFKQRFGRYKAVAVMAALFTLWRHRKVYNLHMEMDGRPVILRTPMLFFGLNSLQFENLGLKAAACTEKGKLAVIVLQPSGPWRLLTMALRGALHQLEDSPDVATHCAARAEVRHFGRRHTRVAVDGEVVECELPLRFELVPDALQIVVPAQPEERK